MCVRMLSASFLVSSIVVVKRRGSGCGCGGGVMLGLDVWEVTNCHSGFTDTPQRITF